MSKPGRPLKSSSNGLMRPRTFLVTSTTWERRTLFRSERMARLFLDVLFAYRKQGKYRLHEFVLMPDHLHLLLTLPPQVSLEKAVQFIKGGFSYRAAKELGFKSEIWQRGFSDEYVARAEVFERLQHYLRNNPVEAGLAREAREYGFSSAYPGFELDPMPEHLRG